MAFCPICGANHDPNYLCVNRAQEVLGDAESNIGFKREQKNSKQSLKNRERSRQIYDLGEPFSHGRETGDFFAISKKLCVNSLFFLCRF